MRETVEGLINRSNRKEGDYIKGGLLHCGECHAEKQCEIILPKAYGGERRKVSIMCRCAEAEYERQCLAEEKAKEAAQVEALKKSGITDEAYLRNTFEADDMRNPKITRMCLDYVENWETMRKDNIGMIFYGDVGTGKSFFACCIANALVEKGIPAKVTSFPEILSKGLGINQEIGHLQKYPLLVIDDLGVERDTSYSVEQIYAVIDARVKARKPLIVTTNLSLSEIKNPAPNYKRIYDRVLGMCPIHTMMVGPSRRTDEAREKFESARQILMPGVRDGS